YLLKEECLHSARAITQKALRQPTWLPRVLREIRRRSDLLTRVFAAPLAPERLARLPDAGLLVLYRRHAARQRGLYRFARLPEALDRGVSYFSTYLMDQLRRRGLAPAEAAETFAVLTQPIVPSVLAQELLEFQEIVAGARSADGPTGSAHASARARMFLRPDL